MARTSIEWTRGADGTEGTSWNPVRGCSHASPGCASCYAESMAARFCGKGLPYEGLIRDGKWAGVARLVPAKLDEPLHWKKPRRVFVNSMSDLFHESLSNEEIAAVFGVIAACPQHTFLLLTKRAKRMREWFEWLGNQRNDDGTFPFQTDLVGRYLENYLPGSRPLDSFEWPLPNLHLGVSVESNEYRWRIDELQQCPAAVRWVSAEPMLGELDLRKYVFNRERAIDRAMNGVTAMNREQAESCISEPISWIVCGGESGPYARPLHPNWPLSLRDQCKEAGVPFFFKQHGEWTIASEANGVVGGRMPDTGERLTWMDNTGKTQNPSWHGLGDSIYAMARVGTKHAGNLLDCHEYHMLPGDKW